MPKYLIEASYSADGVKGVLKDGGTKRRLAAEAAFKSAGARIEAFYFAFGEHDIVAIVDAPDNAALAAAAMAISASGAARTRTTALLTPEEIDRVAKAGATYTPPGHA